MNIDELCDERLGELGMCSQAAKCDVLRPLVLNCGANQNHKKNSKDLLRNSHLHMDLKHQNECEKRMNKSRVKKETGRQIPSTSSFSLKEHHEKKERHTC